MTTQPQPYREPLRATIVRMGTIAIVVGGVLARWRGGLAHWPIAALLVLWPSFGGHWVEVWFLNWLRPRLSSGRGVQVAARVATWFVGGTGLAVGVVLTVMAVVAFRPRHWPAWWLGGVAFKPNFYNGRG